MDATRRTLTITADDFGLHPSYDRGMLEAARAGALDAVSVMILRSPARLDEVLGYEVAVGLHLEAGPGDGLTERSAHAQVAGFERVAGRSPDYLDGHHHCHAAPSITAAVAALAADLDIPVRSVDARHRRLLRRGGVLTPDLLVGRYEESEAVIPAELTDPPAPARWIEWMVHPGHPDPAAPSSYNWGRGEDLEALLAFEPPPDMVRAARPDAG